MIEHPPSLLKAQAHSLTLIRCDGGDDCWDKVKPMSHEDPMRKKGHPGSGPSKAEAPRLELGKPEGQIDRSRMEGPEVCSLFPMVQRQVKVGEPPRVKMGFRKE